MTNKTYSILYISGFLTIIGGLLLIFIVSPKQSFSQFENRVLTDKVEFSIENFINKKFTEQSEQYVTDQFPYRQMWLQMKSIAQQARLTTENNGILQGNEKYLFQPVEEPDWTELEKIVNSINQFSEKLPNTHISLMLAPTSIGMYPQYMPAWSSSYSQAEMLTWIKERLSANLHLLDAQEALEPHAADEDEIYYRNDHHWTSYGAYWAYQQYMQSVGLEPYELSKLQANELSTQFRGSFYIKGQFWNTKPDRIMAYTNPSLTVDHYIADNDQHVNSLFDEEALQQQDQYRYFLSGVHALSVITTNSESLDSDSREKLLVVKDSYAHVMIPFLANHYKEIHIIDPRYYNGSVIQYAKANNIDEIFMMYNIPTFVEERSILNLKYE